MAAQPHPSILEVPEIQDAQFHATKNGSIKQNVNLFRGSVNFLRPLVSFTGRNGLDVKVSGNYQSSVHFSAERSNLIAPTSTLGLGWNLYNDQIIAQYQEIASAGSISYSYVRNGGSNKLFRTKNKWQRGIIDKSFTADLNQGDFSLQLFKAILKNSIKIVNNATITTIKKGIIWHIEDTVNEFSLKLMTDGKDILIYDGGLAFEGESFNFSRIRYYQKFEKWAITDKKGITKIFGGKVNQNADGFKTSAGNSIEWIVRWGNWKGPSMLSHDANGNRVQQQYPQKWNQRATVSRWEDQILYEYDQINQAVGSKGLTYTKANYLTKITGVFGRTATFNYKEKQFDNSSAQSPREYLDPNKPVPDDQADAYQSQYETKYLDSIDIGSKDQQLIFKWQFHYDLKQFASIPSESPPNFFGDSIKRVLTKITKVMPNGSSLPSETYIYNKAGTVNAGALKTRTYKEGAATSYFYTKGNLTTSSRSLQINSPNGIEKPRVWFGPDYAVVLWSNQSNLFIAAYTWAGRWIEWSPKIAPININLLLSSLQVITQDDSFVISYLSQNNQNFFVLPYYKDNTILGSWIESPQSPISLPATQNDIEVIGGKNFFVVNDTATNEVTRFTWNIFQKKWIKDQLYPASPVSGQNRYFLTAANNILVSLNYDILSQPGSKQNVLSLLYLDELGNWQKGDTINAPEISVLGSLPNELRKNFHWTTAPWVFIASAVNNQSAASLDYSLYIYTWNNEAPNAYKFKPVVHKNYTQLLTNTGQQIVPYIAELSTNGIIVSGPNLLRFNGQDWLENDNLKIQTTIDNQNIYWFSHGPDIVLKTENTPNQIISEAQAFDPNTQINNWQESSIPVFNNPPTNPRLSQYHPTGGKDFVSFNRNIYYRGSSTNWEAPLDTPLSTSLPFDANVSSLINAAPNFLAYKTEQNGTTTGTQILVLKSGFIENGPNLLENFFAEIDNKGKVVSDVNGKIPASADSFITYTPLSKNFDEATSLNLYRFLNDDLSGDIAAFTVFKVEIDDGFSTTTTNYDYDFANATVGPLGNTGKFFSVKVNQGISTSKIHGWMEYTYNNGIGLNPAIGNPTIPAGFDGLPDSISIFDKTGKKIKNTQYEWSLFTSILKSPAAKQLSPIRGSFVLPKSTTEILDEVSFSKKFSYDLSSGEEIDQITARYNAEGQLENFTIQKTLAFHQFEQLWFVNALKGIAQTKSISQIENASAIVGAVNATTWKAFSGPKIDANNHLSVYAAYETYNWLGGTSSSDFDFSSWKKGIPPVFNYGIFKGWLKDKVISQRNSFGNPTILQDAQGTDHSVLYDVLGQYKIANFFAANSQDQEAAYYGFEASELARNWVIKHPAAIVDTNAYTGSNSLCLLNGGALTNNFSPKRLQKNYVLGWWYSTSPNYKKSNQSGWQITVSQNGNALPKLAQNIPFEATNGQWKFAYTRIETNTIDTNQSLDIQVTASNTSQVDVFIDNVRFLPDVSHFYAQVYHPVNQLLTATIGIGTQIERTFYNLFLQKTGKVGAFEDQASSFEHTFFSRQLAEKFSTNTPNHQGLLKSLNGGHIETFKGDKTWKNRWNISNFSANWESGHGYLIHHSDTQSDQITATDTDLFADYGLYVEMTAPGANAPLMLTDNFEVKLDTENKFIWNPRQHKWQITINGQMQSPLQASPQQPTSILLISTPKTILFFANGQLILSTNPNPVIKKNAPSIITGKNKIAFRQLAGFKKPSVQVKFYDGAEKVQQAHQLIEDNTTIGAIIYDEIGQKVVATKHAPARFGNIGANVPLMTYNEDFVDVSTFLTNLSTNGELSGNLSTYYNGINNPSNDEQYPYYRNRLEAAPLARVIESGLPGKAFAIINPNSTDPKNRPTTKFLYRNNSKNTFGLPKGEYFVQTNIDPVGNETFQVIDKTKQVLFKNNKDVRSKTQIKFESDGKLVHQFLPNFFNDQLAKNQQFVQSTKYNLLNKVVQTSRPDQGIIKTIYDLGGHKRFYQDAEGAANNYFSYLKYDELNRIIEQGIYHAKWEPVTLRQQVLNPNWPDNDSKQFIQKQINFVLHGATINGIGNLQKATNFNTLDALKVEEHYDYNNFSQIVSKKSVMSDGGNLIQNVSISYKRTFTGKIAQLSYPTSEISGMPDLFYSYDQQNRLIGIGEQNNPFKHAFYQYNTAGELISESTNNLAIPNNLTYYPPGWVKSSAIAKGSSLFGQTIAERYPNSKVKKINDTFNTRTNNNSLQYSIDFDEQDQLTNAKFCNQPDWTVAIQKYDKNGNVLNLSKGTNNLIYNYEEGTNQVVNIKNKNDFDFQGTYDLNGSLKTANSANQSMVFSYIKGQTLTAAVDLKSTDEILNFSYNHTNKRVSKIASHKGNVTAQKYYFHGTNPLPLLEIEDNVATAYIYGSLGLIGFYRDQKFYYITKDHLGSNRLVQDQKGNTIAAFNYETYGKPVKVDSTNSLIINYLYTGQEYDTEIGLYNFRARLYDPNLGRFVSTDPKNQTASPYTYVKNDPFDLTDPTGESFFGDLFSFLFQAIIDVVEIVTAVAIDVVTEGAATPLTGGLLGAGVNGAVYDVGALANHKKPSWKGFGEAQAVGAVTGAATAGFGEIGGAAESGIESATEDAATSGRVLAGKVAAKAANVGIQSAGGAITGVGAKLIENGFEGHPAGQGLGLAALTGGITGGIRSSIGLIGKGIIGPNPSVGRKLASRLVTGAATGAVNYLVVAGIKKSKVNGLDLTLASGARATKNLNGIGKKSAPTIVDDVDSDVDIDTGNLADTETEDFLLFDD